MGWAADKGSAQRAKARPEPRLTTVAAWSGISWLALAAYNFALSAIVFRQVTPAEYGVWATIVAFRTVLLLIDSGLALGVSRDAALETEDPQLRARTAAAHRLYLGLAAATTLVGVLGAAVPGWLLGVTGETRDLAMLVTALFGIETGVTFLASPYAARLRGRQRPEMVALAAVSQAVVGLILAVALTDRLGLAGAAVAALLARVAWLVVLSITERRMRLPVPAGISRVSIMEVGRFAGPLWIAAGAGQLSFGTDVPIVGAIYGPETAGRYSVGLILPSVAVGLLTVLLGAALPRFATAPETRSRLGLRLIFLGCFLAALGFTTLVLHAGSVLTLWLGEASDTSVQVMTIYSVAWAISVPTHLVILMTVAAGRHAVLARIAIAEAVASILLGTTLALLVTPLGPALGTVLALAVSNLVAIPIIMLPRIGMAWRDLVPAMLGGYCLGFVTALPVEGVNRLLGGSQLTQVAVGVGGMLAVAAAALVLVGLRWRSTTLAPSKQGWL